MGTRDRHWAVSPIVTLSLEGKGAGPSEVPADSEMHMSQPPLRPDFGLDADPVGTRGRPAGTGAWSGAGPPRRLVDLLQVEAGHRIGFLDDPGGRGAQLAGELLGRQNRVFLYGVNIGAGLSAPSYADGCFDLVVSAGDSKHWSLVSRALAEVNRLVRVGGKVAVVTPHPLSLLERGLRRVTRSSTPAVRSKANRPRSSAPRGSTVSYAWTAAAEAYDAQDNAVGKRLVEVFGSAERTELGPCVVWHVTQAGNS